MLTWLLLVVIVLLIVVVFALIRIAVHFFDEVMPLKVIKFFCLYLVCLSEFVCVCVCCVFVYSIKQNN